MMWLCQCRLSSSAPSPPRVLGRRTRSGARDGVGVPCTRSRREQGPNWSARGTARHRSHRRGPPSSIGVKKALPMPRRRAHAPRPPRASSRPTSCSSSAPLTRVASRTHRSLRAGSQPSPRAAARRCKGMVRRAAHGGRRHEEAWRVPAWPRAHLGEVAVGQVGERRKGGEREQRVPRPLDGVNVSVLGSRSASSGIHPLVRRALHRRACSWRSLRGSVARHPPAVSSHARAQGGAVLARRERDDHTGWHVWQRGAAPRRCCSWPSSLPYGCGPRLLVRCSDACVNCCKSSKAPSPRAVESSDFAPVDRHARPPPPFSARPAARATRAAARRRRCCGGGVRLGACGRRPGGGGGEAHRRGEILAEWTDTSARYPRRRGCAAAKNVFLAARPGRGPDRETDARWRACRAGRGGQIRADGGAGRLAAVL